MNQTFQVQGMTCGHCERAVTQAVKQVDPQAQVRIDRAQGRVDVLSAAPRDALARAIADEGYAVGAAA
jgi:copper chaperone